MVALRDVRCVEELMDLAIQLAKGTSGDLIALHVVEVPLATPLEATAAVIDQEGKQVLAKAKRVAEGRVPGRFSTRLVWARDIGETIVAEAKEQTADLLVLGHHRDRESTEFLFGSTAWQVAHHAPCKVIIQITAPQLHRTSPEPSRLPGSEQEEVAAGG